jgi:hypothetical protein
MRDAGPAVPTGALRFGFPFLPAVARTLGPSPRTGRSSGRGACTTRARASLDALALDSLRAQQLRGVLSGRLAFALRPDGPAAMPGSDDLDLSEAACLPSREARRFKIVELAMEPLLLDRADVVHWKHLRGDRRSGHRSSYGSGRLD